MLNGFKQELKNKNRAANTLETVDYTLGKAQEALNKPLETLTIEELKKYFTDLKDKKLSPGTIGLNQRLFIQFYDFCLNETDNEKYSIILRKLKRITVDKVKTEINPSEILTSEDIKRLINVAVIERDRCIVASLFESGVRMSEFLSLKNDMVKMDEEKQEVTFHIPNIEGNKTGSRSVVCLEIYGYVQDWMKCNPSDYFMPMKPSGLRKVIRRLFKISKIEKPQNIHWFRHSAITHAAGLNLSETQLSYRFWGIPQSSMLSVYIHLSEQIKSSGYRDAKGMGNDKTIINPLSQRCIECGKLIQKGSLCDICKNIKKVTSENEMMKGKIQSLEDVVNNQSEQMRSILSSIASFEIGKEILKKDKKEED